MIKTYTKQEFIDCIKSGATFEPFCLFAGYRYNPKQHNFTIYQEFDNLTEFLHTRQTHIENGFNVLSCVF